LSYGLDDLLGSLFVGPGYGHYYFGDYYGSVYAGRGFYPWYAYGRRFHDPLYNYYSWRHRGDAGWHQGLHDNFWARRNGTGLRGPSAVAPLSHLAHNPGQMRSVTAPARNDHAVHRGGAGVGGAAFVPNVRQGPGISQRQSFYAAPGHSTSAGSQHFGIAPGSVHMSQPRAGHSSPAPTPRSFAPSHGSFSRPAGPSRSSRSFSRSAPAARSSGGRSGGNSRGGGGGRSGGSGHRHK